MKLLMIFSYIILQPALAAMPYEWDKDIGNGRFERGTDAEVKLIDIKERDIFRLAKSCQDDEVFITGGCGTAYGMTVTNSFPFTSRVVGSKTEWVCTGRPDFETALTVAGNYPAHDTAKDQLLGDLMVVIVCEKIK